MKYWVSRAMLAALVVALAGVTAPARARVDHIGRRVEVPDPVRRIVSLAPSLTEALFALDLGERVVGVTDYCDYPVEAKSRPKVGGIINPNVEAIVSAQPDLVLIARETNRRETVSALERLGIAVFVLNAERLDDVFRLLRDLADLCGAPERGTELAARLQRQSARIQSEIQNAPPRRVFLLVGLQPVVTVGRGTFLDDLLQRSGAQSISASRPEPWPRFSIEEILRADPDYLLVPATPWFSPTREELSGMPGWSQLRAVRENNIVYLPAAAERPGPRLIEVQELIARALHPGATSSPRPPQAGSDRKLGLAGRP